MRIFSIPKIVRIIFPSAYWKISAEEKSVYLTFDDGPTPLITEWVIEQLDKYNAQASFFCIGKNIELYPDIFSKICKKNHSIGNHTFNHLNCWNVSNSSYNLDIEKASKLIESNLFRPPYGKLTFSAYNHLKKHYKIIMWDIIVNDWDKNLDAIRALDYLKKHTKSGSIILFHDSLKAKEKLEKILPDYLKWLKEENFFCKKILL